MGFIPLTSFTKATFSSTKENIRSSIALPVPDATMPATCSSSARSSARLSWRSVTRLMAPGETPALTSRS